MVPRSVVGQLRPRVANSVNSRLSACKLETQEQPIFQFTFEGWKRPVSQLSSQARVSSHSAFLFYSGLDLTE